MEECWNEDCEKHDVFIDNNCRLYKNIENCAARNPLITQKEPVAEVPCSAGLEGQSREFERLKELERQLVNLIADSDGVAGLHLNGDLADWTWLIENEWLSAIVSE